MPSFKALLQRFRTQPDQSDQPNPQLKSLLFTKLPSEIRLLIYSFALPPCSNYLIANYLIEERKQKTVRIPWSGSDSDFAERHAARRHYHHGGEWLQKAKYELVFPRMGRVIPDVMVVCRRMHDECVDQLYTTRGFNIEAPSQLIHLHASTPPPLFQLITKVRFVHCWKHMDPRPLAKPLPLFSAGEDRESRFPTNLYSNNETDNLETWTRALAILTKEMPNLHSFHILLSHGCWVKKQEVDYQSGINAQRYTEISVASLARSLDWAKEVPCSEKVAVQLVKNICHRDEDGSVDMSRYVVTEMRLRDGEWVDEKGV